MFCTGLIAFCVKCQSTFTTENDPNLRTINSTSTFGLPPKVGWFTACPSCGSHALVSDPLTITADRARQDLSSRIEALEWFNIGITSLADPTGTLLVSGNLRAVPLTPLCLGYEHLHRNCWHPTEWENIAKALDELFGPDWRLAEEKLALTPEEIGKYGNIGLFGQLRENQPFYFFAKSGTKHAEWKESH